LAIDGLFAFGVAVVIRGYLCRAVEKEGLVKLTGKLNVLSFYNYSSAYIEAVDMPAGLVGRLTLSGSTSLEFIVEEVQRIQAVSGKRGRPLPPLHGGHAYIAQRYISVGGFRENNLYSVMLRLRCIQQVAKKASHWWGVNYS